MAELASSSLVRICATLGISMATYSSANKIFDEIDTNNFITVMGTEYAQNRGLALDVIEQKTLVQLADIAGTVKQFQSLQPTLDERDGSAEIKEMEERVKVIFDNNIYIGRSEHAIEKTKQIARALEKTGISANWLDTEVLADEKRSQIAPEMHFETHGKFKKAFTAEDIEAATKHLPKGWYQGEVSRVTITEKRPRMPQSYGFSKKNSAAVYNRKKSEIITHEDFLLSSKKEKIKILYHEIGHANDWSSDNQMTRKQRLTLLLAVYNRTQAKDRYKSAYVESIHNKDPKVETAMRATEYWAEICRAYIMGEDLDVEDYALVDGVVSVADPTYSPTANIKKF